MNLFNKLFNSSLLKQIHILVYQLSIKMSKDDGRQIAWAILPIRESLNACGELVDLLKTGTCSKTAACITSSTYSASSRVGN